MEEIRESTKDELVELLLRYPTHDMVEHISAQDLAEALGAEDPEIRRAAYYLLGRVEEGIAEDEKENERGPNGSISPSPHRPPAS